MNIGIFFHNSNTPVQDTDGNTVLHLAIQNKDTEAIIEILDYCIKIHNSSILNVQNKDGDTPLHLAVRNLPLNKISNLMISLGAKTDIKNNENEVVVVAQTLGEYLENANNTDSDSMWNLSALTIIENDLPTDDDSVSFPSHLSIEKSPKLCDVWNEPRPVGQKPYSELPMVPNNTWLSDSVSFPSHLSVEPVVPTAPQPNEENSITFPSHLSIENKPTEATPTEQVSDLFLRNFYQK